MQIIFVRSKYGLKQCIHWLETHGFNYEEVTASENSFMFIQASPLKLDELEMIYPFKDDEHIAAIVKSTQKRINMNIIKTNKQSRSSSKSQSDSQ